MAHNDGTSGETHKIILALTSLKLIQKSNKKVKVNLNRQWKKRSKNGVKGPQFGLDPQICYKKSYNQAKITISKRCLGFVGPWENSILQSNYSEMPVSGPQSNIKDIIGFKMSSGATAVEFCGVVKQDNQDSCPRSGPSWPSS